MGTITRKNAWNNQGTFDNPDLYWYAKAVGELQSRSLNDPTSWWFFAAIHGQYLIPDVNAGYPPPVGYPNWGNIPGKPSVPTTPLPAAEFRDKYWDQCQHGTWFFPPWHRGYLYAIENIMSGIIQSMGGPTDWALPYWNYFGPADEYRIPPAFTQNKMPDGSPNPLFVNARFGPNNDGIIFIPVSARGINQDCQQNTRYIGVQPDYYGGGETDFDHDGYNERGNLEGNPHNPVHVAIGGQNQNGKGGLMSIPNTAALDPVFYLHHCNIDRMWAAWNAASNTNPASADWLNGPGAKGDRMFYMPKPDGSEWRYTPEMVNDISQLDYTYDNLSLVTGPVLASNQMLRLRKFGLKGDQIKSLKNMEGDQTPELIGANHGSILLDASGARTTVKLDERGWQEVAGSLGLAMESNAESLPDEIYLELEGIKGDEDSIVCSVSVDNQYVGHISLFGLRNASIKSGHHGGTGLTIRLNISKVVDKLQINDAMDINSLDVIIQPVNIIAKGNEITIDRISVFRKSQDR